MRLFLFQLLQVLIAFDQLINTLIGVFVCPFTKNTFWADETMSSVSHRLSLKGITWPKTFVNDLFFWQDDHCKDAFQSERERSQAHPETR